MEVALLVCSTDEDVCVGLGIILECSPQGTWEGFTVLHRDYVVVRLTAVFHEYSHHASYCEIPDFITLGDFVGYRILWSGYRVRPAHCSTPHVQSLQGSAPSVGRAPTSGASATISPDSRVGRQPTGPGVEDDSQQACSAAGINEEVPDGALPYPDRPFWRGKYCLLLNEDFSVHGRAFIQVCLPDEPFDENVLGDTDVGVMYVSENNDLQMTTMR
jgi:hypothetical protein